MAGVLGGTGVNAGGANSKPKEARCEASNSPFPPAGAKPRCRSCAALGPRFQVAGLRRRELLAVLHQQAGVAEAEVCSFCGLAKLSVAVTEGSRSANLDFIRRAKLTPIVAATVSAIAPAVSVQRRELGGVDV